MSVGRPTLRHPIQLGGQLPIGCR